jgi:hypothetical protein
VDGLSVLCLLSCPGFVLVLLGSLPLVLVAGSCRGCVHWTPPFLVNCVNHILLELFFQHRNSHLYQFCLFHFLLYETILKFLARGCFINFYLNIFSCFNEPVLECVGGNLYLPLPLPQVHHYLSYRACKIVNAAMKDNLVSIMTF